MKIITPFNETLLVLRDETKEKKSDGGIFLADRSIELANEGEVRAVPDDVFDENDKRIYHCPFNPGDRILFTKYAGNEVEINGVEYLLLKQKEIQGRVREVFSANEATPQSTDDVAAAAAEALAKLGAK